MGAEQENIEVEMVAVAEAVATAVDHIRPVCLKKNITIETDLDGTHVQADQNLVVPATASLLTNAINAMPAGGVLSVTLVDTDSQWELEVADSGRSPSRFNAPENTSNETRPMKSPNTRRCLSNSYRIRRCTKLACWPKPTAAICKLTLAL